MLTGSQDVILNSILFIDEHIKFTCSVSNGNIALLKGEEIR